MLAIKKSKIHGHGVFTDKKITKGTECCHYSGKLFAFNHGHQLKNTFLVGMWVMGQSQMASTPKTQEDDFNGRDVSTKTGSTQSWMPTEN